MGGEKSETQKTRHSFEGVCLEDLDRETLAALAAEAGYNAHREALAAGFTVTKFVEGQLMLVDPDGTIRPYESGCYDLPKSPRSDTRVHVAP